MRTVSKKTTKILNYMAENPTAKVAVIAKKFKTAPTYIYTLRAKAKSAATKGVKAVKRGRPRQMPSTLVPNAVMSMAVYADDVVNHPSHYKVGGIETIDFIEAKELDYHLGNVVKYISRADHKDEKLENLKKAQWYLNRAVSNLEKRK